MAAENPSPSEALPPFDPDLDHFARLGLRPGYAVDRDAVEAAYLERSKVVHPDRFATAGSGTRRAALEHSSALNEAYRVVRDRVLRAEYLVKLGGTDLDSSDPEGGAPKPEQAFLIDMIERRDAIDEGGVDLDDLRDSVEDELEAALASAVAGLDAGDHASAAAALVRRRYLDRFLAEIDDAIG
ncbi:co-chaperone HscB [Plesiocystis pacifica SIR-1]|uniref:Co-chaperone HscB n=1 Tax=Plesiocystis pacifica SIR-1 TaxID=391625 RepID=A6GIR1_9BACT|nr:Fe-S protein assembly co-chaperone HscB [Plesiocystis pacifica]EDM74249.1 co-chaperone HscB [Plesiocystis pacifica SIR-1]